MKKIGVYKIQSIINTKRCYIGSAVNINDRWRCHLKNLRIDKHHSIKLQNHYNKYGEEDLQFTILLCCDKEDLIKIEQYFIDTYNPWFNCSPTAGNCLGVKHSEEYKEKIRKIRIGTKATIDTKNKLSDQRKGEKNNFYGKHHSEETKEKMRNNRTGKGYHSEQWKVEQSKRMSGENHPLYGIKLSKEQCLKHSERMKGRKASIETKNKMRESGKKAWMLRKQLKNKLCV
jgi:group I intron endonuclease